MRRAIVLFGLVVTVAACGDEPTAPPVPDPQMAAVTVSVNEREPLDTFVFLPCANEGAGESVHLLGTLHIVSRITVTSEGSTRVLHFNAQNVTGTGLTTGMKYRATDVEHEVITEAPLFEEKTITYIRNFAILGRGPGNDLLHQVAFHLTNTPTGFRVTAGHVNEVCR